MLTALKTRPGKVIAKPLGLIKEVLLRKKFTKIEPLSFPVKRLSIYGINEGNTVEGRNWRESFLFLLDRYGQRTTVHGMNRICRRGTGFKERIVWTLGFCVALYLLIGMYALLSANYRRRQFQTTVNDTFYPIYKLSFPEIVICNNNRLNWARLNESKAKFLAPKHRTPKFERLFTKIMTLYRNLTVSSLGQFKDLDEEPLIDLNYINFTNVVDFMSWRCDEILSDCKWRLKGHNCCDIFFPRRTRLGQCLAFNSVLTKEGQEKMKSDPFWPWHYGRYGRGSGLQLRVMLNDEMHSLSDNNNVGIVFMTVDRAIYSDYLFTPVRANNIAHVAIWGSISFMEKLGRSVPAVTRGCVFQDELKTLTSLEGFPYQHENCVYECQQRQMVRSCGCSVDLFFPSGHYPACQLIDMPCLAEKGDDFAYYEAADEPEIYENESFTKSLCDCFFSCFSLLLQNYLRVEPVNPQNMANISGSVVDLDFYWRRNYILTFKTSLVFNWLDLLVSFGGIASLLLGCSVVSAVELLVFLLMETPDFIWKKRRSDKRLKVLRQKSSIQNLINYDSTH